ncbi:MAG: DNRLRE domain-containing protein, partial [Gaiellaceae bacterium]
MAPLALASALAFGLPAAGAPSSSSATATFRPLADAEVSSAQPGRNFGSSQVLGVDRHPAVRSYLRFRVLGLAAPVRSATLRIYVGVARGHGLLVAGVRGPWNERRITFANAPPLSGSLGRTRIARPGWADVDVTRAVRRAGVVQLALTYASPAGAIQ